MFDDEIKTLPIAPPRDPGLLPGLRLNEAVSRGTLAPLAFVLLFTLMPLSIFFGDSEAQLRFKKTQTVQAQVVAVGADEARGNETRITYAFTATDGLEYRGNCCVPKGSPYSGLKPGDHLPVRYLLSDPSVNAPVGGEPNGPPLLVFLLFPAFGLLVFSPMFVPQLRTVMRARRIVRSGLFAKGTVRFVKQRSSVSWPGFPGTAAEEVFISYDSPSAGKVEARADCRNKWLLNHLPPGAPVNIAFLPEQPKEAVLLDAYIR